ncbi:MAG: type II 3-dehydroquinate dehydratase [Kiritimatiellales bacterium]|nr:type II 3-dehydroquinate dehydratase [Kiritimatiellota bacterium]MBL7012228.1 type II 3-dehydroquinate dehydratase [Kiritimatiellales bacterium]
MKALKILVLNGPNLNLLGTREPDVYGTETLDSIAKDLTACAETLGGVELEFVQSNAESDLITRIGETRGAFDGIIINPAALTHTSLGVADAIKAVADVVPAVEVHLSNTHAREEIRHKSLSAAGCIGQIMGFKGFGYTLALQALVKHLRS